MVVARVKNGAHRTLRSTREPIADNFMVCLSITCEIALLRTKHPIQTGSHLSMGLVMIMAY